MPSLHMGADTYRFEMEVIERVVNETGPGNYALGIKDESGEFVPKYVGRSDTNLREKLRSKKQELGQSNYTHFKFSYSSAREAYDMECSHVHMFGPQLDNTSHPVAPMGSGFRCFLCGQ